MAETPPVPFRAAVGVWARIGLLGFGGPAAQIALMHRVLVDERRWLGERRFLHALSFCTLLPGPEAQQLATYAGWLLHGTRGGLVAGTLFVLPGFLAILGLTYLYVGFSGAPAVTGLFFGLKAGVLALVAEAVARLARRALRHRALLGVAGVAFVALHLFAVPFPAVVAAAAALGLVGARTWPDVFAPAGEDAGAVPAGAPAWRRSLKVGSVWLALWLGPVVLLVTLLGRGNVFAQVAVFFSQAAVVTFGGAYAVLAYMAQQAVEHYGWLTPGEMLDGLGLAETTPGPLIQVVQFVAFLGAWRSPGALDPWLAGTLAAVLATWVTYTPSFLWIFLGAPYMEALRAVRPLRGALTGVTAAVVGVVANLALWFGLHVLFGRVDAVRMGPLHLLRPAWETLDPVALALAAGAAVAVLGFKAGAIPTLAGFALLGVLWHLAAGGG